MDSPSSCRRSKSQSRGTADPHGRLQSLPILPGHLHAPKGRSGSKMAPGSGEKSHHGGRRISARRLPPHQDSHLEVPSAIGDTDIPFSRIATMDEDLPRVLSRQSGEEDSDSSGKSLKLEEDLEHLEAQALRRERQRASGTLEINRPVPKSRLSRGPSYVRASTLGAMTETPKRAGSSAHLLDPSAFGEQSGDPRSQDTRGNAPGQSSQSRSHGSFRRQASPSPLTNSRRASAATTRGSASASKIEADSKNLHTKLEGALKALTDHPLMEGVRMSALMALSRVAVFKEHDDIIKQLGSNSQIIVEGEQNISADFAFIIESGFVQVEEHDEILGTLTKGHIFGHAPAFGHAETQPFTISIRGLSGDGNPDDCFSCWCIPHAVVRQTLRQFPDARTVLEARIGEQMKKLLAARASRLMFFRHCGTGFFENLLAKMKVLHYVKGSDIVKGNEVAEYMLIVVAGSVKLGVSKGRSHRPKKDGSDGPSKSGTCENSGEADMEDDDNGSDGERSNSSSDRSSSSEEEFLPPVCPDRPPTQYATAGPEGICFGEGILFDYQTTLGRNVSATRDCTVLSLGKNDFTDMVDRHPRERQSFRQMHDARYQELKRSDIARLASVEMFSRCSDSFLTRVMKAAVFQLFFHGDDIIAEGLVPRGILLLMSGTADLVHAGNDRSTVTGPQSFGTLEWLGVQGSTETWSLTAQTLCLVLIVAREQLLDALKDFPQESTAMVQQVLRHNGIRLSIQHGATDTSAVAATVGLTCTSQRRGLPRHNVWHMPFCKGTDPGFLARLTVELKVCKLIPGQMIFSQAPSPQTRSSTMGAPAQTGEPPDFLVILVNGTVQVDESLPNRKSDGLQWKQVHSPLVITGFNRKHRAMVVTSSVCEIHRLSMPSCHSLAAEYPRDLRRVLERMHQFQERREKLLGSSWWCPSKSLRYQSWFKESDEHFLKSVVANLHTQLFLPGEILVVEGDAADSTMLLECGTAVIERIDTRSLYSSDRIGEIHDGYWIGEMAMFAGESKRRASIKALTVCKVQRLYNQELVALLDSHPTERQRFRHLAEHRLRAVEKERLEDHDFFKEFERAFLNLLRQKCRPQVFFANEVMLKQGDIAESLFILGTDSIITMEVDGVKVKKLIGRACLGTKALLSHRPVKRASTVITQNVCAVRVLTRDDWLDALKLHPEHQRWLASFTKQQMGKIGEARQSYMRRRAWEMIQHRENAATIIHCERLADPELFVRPASIRRRPKCTAGITFRKLHHSHNESNDVGTLHTGASGSDEVETNTMMPEPCFAEPESWECFNGSKILVPHTILPQLGSHVMQDLMPGAEEVVREEEGHMIKSCSDASFQYEDCEEALGVAGESTKI